MRGALARVAAAAAAGVLLDLSFPGVGWWPLAPVALAGLFLVTAGAGVRRGAEFGLVFGLAFFVPHLQWSGIYVGPVPWLALALLQALYVAAFGLLVGLLRRWGASPRTQVLVSPLLWVVQEAARSRTPFGGFPWGRVAFSQADSPVLGWAWLGGAPVVSFVVAVAGALLALAASLAVTRASGVRRADELVGRGPAVLRRWGPVVTVGAASLLVTGSGALVPRGAEPSGSLQVSAVQGNVARPGLDFNAERRQVLENHVRGTERLADQVAAGDTPRPDLVVWPENSSDIDPTRDPEAARAITGAARAVGAPVVVGAVLREPAPRISNATLVWSGSEVTDRYVKRRPVPFAEYVPYRSFFRRITSAVDLVRTDFAAGHGSPTLDAGAARLGVAICFEVAFDDQLRDAVLDGADLLAVPTNNATFGRTDESVQQLAMSRLRAVELGRSVVHISTVGVSGLITPDGSVVRTGGHFTPEVLSARLATSRALTPAARVGTLPELLIAGAGVLVLLGLAARHRLSHGASHGLSRRSRRFDRAKVL